MKATTSPGLRALHGTVLLVSLCSLVAALLPGGCGGASARDEFGSDEGGAGGPSGPGISPDSGAGISGDGGCQLLECQLVDCEAGPKTTVTGTVYDPAGNIALYNAIVYVPNTRNLPPIVQGASCDRCGTLAVDPVTSDLTDIKGQFVLENVPVGEDIPIVVQVGKWRKEIRMTVEACKENKIVEKLTLPKNQQEGAMPRIAAALGSADPLVCLLRRIGVDDSEFTLPGAGGAVQSFEGCRTIVPIGDYRPKVQDQVPPEAKAALWDTTEHLMQYDIVLLACEGAEYNGDQAPRGIDFNNPLAPTCGNKTPAAKEHMRDYLNAGGRVFATHYHYTWFKDGPEELRGVAEWGSSASAEGSGSYSIDRTFPKGEAFGDWLEENGAGNGQTLQLAAIGQSIHAATPASQRWVYGTDEHPVKYLSFNTPVSAEPDAQCGRAVISDIHVGADTESQGDRDLPGSCGSNPLSDQEKALLFMLMDLSSCVQDDSVVPQVPN